MRRALLSALLAISVSGCASLPFSGAGFFSPPTAGLEPTAASAGDEADAHGLAATALRAETLRARMANPSYAAGDVAGQPIVTAPDSTAGAGSDAQANPRSSSVSGSADSLGSAAFSALPADFETDESHADRLAEESAGDLWQRIRDGFGMPDLDSSLVAEKERFYLQRPDELQRMFERGSRYLYFIVEELEKRGMPTELALLPFVESAMDPNALSSAQAAGLWQFIPSTGRQYDLSQNWWVDNRRDVVKSTQAALDYLQKIYELQGRDWFLALASYNAGEGAVQRAMRYNERRKRGTDYLSLRLPRETRHYVPKLIALKRIVQRADALGVSLPPVANRPYFVTIEKTRPIDLKLAARFADMSVAEFVALNPAHNRPVIAASRNNQIVLPADRERRFLQALERHVEADRTLASWQPYELKAGETLKHVAARAGITVAELCEANGLRITANILPGSRILAPQRDVADEMQVEQFLAPRVIERVALPNGYHRVRRGDTLGAIARRYGTSVASIRHWNRLHSTLIRPGMRLVVSKDTPATVVTNESGVRRVVASQGDSLLGPQVHRVQRGDTLGSIARRYGVSVQMLKHWNGLRSDLIRPGMGLLVRPPASKVVQTESNAPASQLPSS